MRVETMTKAELRKWIKAQKKELSEEEIVKRSRRILERLTRLPEYLAAKRVYAYVSYNQEVSTFEFMKTVLADGKTLLVPKVYGEQMRYHEISDLSELVPGAYGILEPDNERLDTVFEGFLLLPGLAFDKAGHRLGYGGGFYDRYLSEHPAHYKVAAAYDFQVFEEIPHEEYDIAVDLVVAELDLYDIIKIKKEASTPLEP